MSVADSIGVEGREPERKAGITLLQRPVGRQRYRGPDLWRERHVRMNHEAGVSQRNGSFEQCVPASP